MEDYSRGAHTAYILYFDSASGPVRARATEDALRGARAGMARDRGAGAAVP